MLDRDFDKVVDLCMEQAPIWRAQKSSRVTDRQVQERRVVELENIIGKLTNAIEQGQPVAKRLKEGQQELDTLRGKTAVADAVPDRKEVMKLLQPLGWSAPGRGRPGHGPAAAQEDRPGAHYGRAGRGRLALSR